MEIDQNDDRDQDVEKKLYTEDPHCLVAGQPLTEFDLYPSVAVNLRRYGIRCALGGTVVESQCGTG